MLSVLLNGKQNIQVVCKTWIITSEEHGQYTSTKFLQAFLFCSFSQPKPHNFISSATHDSSR